MTLTPDLSASEMPAGIPSTRLTGRYIAPDGTPLVGSVSFAPPSVLTLPGSDIFAATPAKVTLDEQGGFEVTLIATDAPGMSPSHWAYQVTEKLKGLPRRVFHIALPASATTVDLADIAPINPYTGNYLPVTGPRGAKGEKGEPGDVSLAQLSALEARTAPRPQEWTQSAGSNEWTIPHTLPYRPLVTVYDTSGREIGGSVDYPSPTTVRVRFAVAETGSAVLH
ncbi:hypothetical protein [Streptomyces sp. MMBL 11-1]|uniref:hypothetical protein n=1 Tax=Streptomyces sp. MMBL 11-1 TaxID=3026420 RepID=UPI00235F39D4|nr:hypothetical protein [Streptomyces sp. MMBL 11-1]